MPSLFRRLLLLVALLTAASACSRPAPPKPQLSAAMKALLGPKGEVNAGGETPSWSAQVRPGKLNISLATGSDVTVPVTDFAADPASARWAGKTPAGAVVALTVVRKACADGATVMTYPLTAKAEVGGQTIAGCAAAPGQGLGPRS